MKNINVLLIEDNEVEAFVIREEVQDYMGIEKVQHYSSGNAALEFILTAPEEALPDLILLDLNMDSMDGFELMDQLEESDRYAFGTPFKIYILTNSEMRRDRELFERQPLATVFLEKSKIQHALADTIYADFFSSSLMVG